MSTDETFKQRLLWKELELEKGSLVARMCCNAHHVSPLLCWFQKLSACRQPNCQHTHKFRAGAVDHAQASFPNSWDWQGVQPPVWSALVSHGTWKKTGSLQHYFLHCLCNSVLQSQALWKHVPLDDHDIIMSIIGIPDLCGSKYVRFLPGSCPVLLTCISFFVVCFHFWWQSQ